MILKHTVFRSADQLGQLSDLHGGNTLIPSFDNLAY